MVQPTLLRMPIKIKKQTFMVIDVNYYKNI